jgi:hypothetical protein
MNVDNLIVADNLISTGRGRVDEQFVEGRAEPFIPSLLRF